MCTHSIRVLMTVACLAMLPTAWVIAQKTEGGGEAGHPPKFEKADPFFANAFESGLSGQRPADLGKAVAASSGPAAGNSGGSSAAGSSAGSASGWAAIISSTTLRR